MCSSLSLSACHVIWLAVVLKRLSRLPLYLTTVLVGCCCLSNVRWHTLIGTCSVCSVLPLILWCKLCSIELPYAKRWAPSRITSLFFTDMLTVTFASAISGDIRLFGFLAYVPPYLYLLGENFAVCISHAQSNGRFVCTTLICSRTYADCLA